MLNLRYLTFLGLLLYQTISYAESISFSPSPKIWQEIPQNSFSKYQLIKNRRIMMMALWSPTSIPKEDPRLIQVYKKDNVRKIIAAKKEDAKRYQFKDWRIRRKIFKKLAFILYGSYLDKDEVKHNFVEKHFYFKGHTVRFTVDSKDPKTSFQKLEKFSRKITVTFQ